jgi:predicted RNA-binding protein associated with RNAse of E/G family
VIFDDTIYHVIHFWTPEGKFAGWYINFESPSRRHGNQVLTFDWQLDLWITPEGTGQWKDEDEAAAAIDAGMLTREELADSFAAGQEILDNFAAFLERAGDWREWSAPSSWTAMQLPF